jgi:tripartite-type tricarboxylate transporter receptor subunit TctC
LYLATELGENWKQPVVVENRLGAGSNVAAQAMANAPADGYTLLSVKLITSEIANFNRLAKAANIKPE